jgi:hypothetical protein
MGQPRGAVELEQCSGAMELDGATLGSRWIGATGCDLYGSPPQRVRHAVEVPLEAHVRAGVEGLQAERVVVQRALRLGIAREEDGEPAVEQEAVEP